MGRCWICLLILAGNINEWKYPLNTLIFFLTIHHMYTYSRANHILPFKFLSVPLIYFYFSFLFKKYQFCSYVQVCLYALIKAIMTYLHFYLHHKEMNIKNATRQLKGERRLKKKKKKKKKKNDAKQAIICS